MQIRIELFTAGSAPQGIDFDALEKDIQAEMAKFKKATGATDSFERVPAPDGAMGFDQILIWLAEVAQDPAAAKAYVKGLVFAINQIVIARGVPKKDDTTENANEDGNAPLGAKLKLLGKEISLPLTVAALKKLMEDLFGDE